MNSLKKKSGGGWGNILNQVQVLYLRRLIGERTRQQAEKDWGIGNGSLSQILNQKKGLGRARAKRIAAAEGIPYEEFIHQVGLGPRPDTAIIQKIQAEAVKGGETFPVMGRIAADDSFGARAHFYDEDQNHGHMTLPQHLAVFNIQGTSADPIARHGEYVLVDLDRSAEDKDLVVVRDYHGNGFFKRVFLINGFYELTAINPQIAQAPIRIKREDVHFLGVVIGVVFETAGLYF